MKDKIELELDKTRKELAHSLAERDRIKQERDREVLKKLLQKKNSELKEIQKDMKEALKSDPVILKELRLRMTGAEWKKIDDETECKILKLERRFTRAVWKNIEISLIEDQFFNY